MTRDGPRGTARDARRGRARDARSDTARDAQRARVYAAENFVRTMFDRAAERGDPAVEFFGTSLTLPPEARFSSAETVQRYVDEVLAHPAVRERWPVVSPLKVRTRRGHTAAHYECDADADGLGEARAAAIIAVPERGSSLALRELVVFFGHFAPVYVLNVLTIASPLPLNGVAGASRLSPARNLLCDGWEPRRGFTANPSCAGDP